MRRLCLSLFTLCLSVPVQAAPGHLIVSVDLERGDTLARDDSMPTTGAGVRVGYGLDLGVVELIPEARLMAWGDAGHVRSATVEGGGRVMFGKVLEPGVYARAVAPVGDGGGPPMLNAGGLLDLTAIPALDLGVHGGVLAGDVRGPSWLGGAHLTLNF